MSRHLKMELQSARDFGLFEWDFDRCGGDNGSSVFEKGKPYNPVPFDFAQGTELPLLA